MRGKGGSESKMRGKGVMGGLSQPKSCSRKKTRKSGNMKGKFENVVLIDVDGDRCENVIIIDAPESVEEDLQGSSRSKGGKQFPSPGVISIDDDETDDMGDPNVFVECGGDLDSDASSSKSCPAPDFPQKSAGLNGEECHFFREKKSAFKLSKCKKTCTEPPCGKRFGLSPESEDSISESDCSDCEVMEGSAGKLREEWEKAFQRKKYNVRNGQSGLEDQNSASGLCNDTPGVEGENQTKQHAETPASSGSSDSNIQKQNSSAFETHRDSYSRGTCLNCRTEGPSVESDKKIDHESFSQPKYGPNAEPHFSHVQADVIFGTETFMKNPPSRDGDQEFPQASSNCEPYPSDLQHGKTGSNGQEKLQSKESLMSIAKYSDEKRVDLGMTPFDVEVGTVFDESSSVKIPLGGNGMPVVRSKNYCDREKVLSRNSSQYDEIQVKQFSSGAEQSSVNSVSNGNKYDERVTLNVQGVDVTASGEKDIIINREKHKETDEYKRAEEEEWASRQRELQIQAEEAQRMRKRKKAESMRLLDMERRQKQRLEEMRESQKKDEENMNLKEQLRSEVRKELSKLEISCIDMASLLRCLGVPVDGGYYPMSDEVHAAYKRALLRFHPDRASKTDIRQQVEAEEKFKLISRMKEKFLAASCH
ncbi:uncharacterized protein LOC111318230 [Durio zibethinus]|uniref:Uncharacterized protein LOC111318230 n=1 Tax=Durio zibethinus TaxID=66656 RepID=A0A6P6BHW3_DURZI|nr:uncharacterized protein LOC111318230 [Durio zibethinus]XP_022776702.1 uncharacterized protein LOC111318230 [Durio zibethinus]